MAGGSFEIVGAVELGKMLEGFTDKIRAKVIRKALKEAAHVIYARAVALVPEDTGLLADTIKVTTFTNKQSGTLGANIGIIPGPHPPRKKGRLAPYPDVYGIWVEYGHKVGSKRAGSRSARAYRRD